MKKLLDHLTQDFPAVTFVAGDDFEWQPKENSVIYDLSDPSFEARLLHELGHAQLHHEQYERDIDLIAMERDAWQHARMELGPKYGVAVSGDTIHNDMDTYRDWLHERSTCPKCSSSGIETKKLLYRCVTCAHQWRVNEARTCALRRYDINKNTL